MLSPFQPCQDCDRALRFKKSVESYPPQRLPRRVQYQIQFIPRLDLESVELRWLDRYSELTQSTREKEKKTNQQIPYKRNPSQQESIFQRNQRFLCKRKPMKIWNKLVKIRNKPVTLSKALKKSLDWRITYLTLNPPLLECRIFVFGALPVGR